MKALSYHNKHRKLAMLIDADNIQQPDLLDRMLETIELYGTLMIQHAYGDWTQTRLTNWIPPLKAHSIELIQQTQHVNSKNSTDIRMVIDAMDILHHGNMQGFCIVSSDSDFTSLCLRIRNEGLFVMGIGHNNTPVSFVKACQVFFYIEDFRDNLETEQKLLDSIDTYLNRELNGAMLPVFDAVSRQPNGNKPSPESTDTREYLSYLLKTAYLKECKNNAWIELSKFGSAIRKIDPQFTSKKYGFNKLSQLIQHYPHVIELRKRGKQSNMTHHVRLKH